MDIHVNSDMPVGLSKWGDAAWGSKTFGICLSSFKEVIKDKAGNSCFGNTKAVNKTNACMAVSINWGGGGFLWVVIRALLFGVYIWGP